MWKRKLGFIFPDCLGWMTFEGARREMEDPPVPSTKSEVPDTYEVVWVFSEMLPVLLQMGVIEE